MFDIGFFELLLIGIVGLLVLGPERLPIAARTAGLWIGRIRRSVANMQREITSQLEAEELRQKLAEQQRKLDEGVGRVRQEVEQGQRQLDEGVGRARHEVEKTLGVPVIGYIPSSRLVPAATNRGVAIVADQPKHAVSAAFNRLISQEILNETAPAEKRGGLFGLRREA